VDIHATGSNHWVHLWCELWYLILNYFEVLKVFVYNVSPPHLIINMHSVRLETTSLLVL
jgi:hypothetical protein